VNAPRPPAWRALERHRHNPVGKNSPAAARGL